MIQELKSRFSFREAPGDAPGVEHDEIVALPSGAEPVRITCSDYGPNGVIMQDIEDLENFLGQQHRPEWSVVRWINVDGLSDMKAIHALATKYELHPLAIEDLLQVTQPTAQGRAIRWG